MRPARQNTRFRNKIKIELNAATNITRRLSHLLSADLTAEGIPTEEELLTIYCQKRGLTLPLANWHYFLALIFFLGASRIVVRDERTKHLHC